MRAITDHVANPANDLIDITVMDEPGAGGANHHYKIGCLKEDWSQHIQFQNGPIPETGVNGVTQEALLAIVADRLRAFQAGSFANGYNERALQHVEMALEELKSRTRERMSRGVEGTHQV